MGQTEIVSKLEEQLKREFKEECQIVYILSRIGKIIEIEQKSTQYSFLQFYRNWVLHARLNKFSQRFKDTPVYSAITSFINNRDSRSSLLLHEDLLRELTAFCSDYNLPILSDTQQHSFTYLLGKVVADTPLEITDANSTYTLTISEPPNQMTSGTYCLGVTIRVKTNKLVLHSPSVEVVTS